MARNRYDAFISYRHSEPDREIAARLHKKLESFRLPKTIAAKIRKTRLHRVFRDEAELAVSDDLSQAIETALQNSKYLIAVCSPEYLKSVWCQKEITKFLEFSDRKHVLLVLAEGDPENAFPEVLLYNDVIEEYEFGRKRKVRKPHEPLAADCRGANAKERNEKVDNAVIRLVAAMFGVGYDDLMQRHRKEKNMRRTRRTLIAFGILAAVIAICIFFLFKISKQNDEIIKQNEEISRQNEEITRRYADSLAATSDNLLRDGRRKDAIYAARLGLSDEKTDTYSDAA
ncbi:MAG: toll/interleukin-1 receptor domain-containing protein, partial [Lachnospiraceae bacterium]|nr:toll/interleukin-1 receptor domain-containing protein [Lachnospiraceae bacterium]